MHFSVDAISFRLHTRHEGRLGEFLEIDLFLDGQSLLEFISSLSGEKTHDVFPPFVEDLLHEGVVHAFCEVRHG